VSSLEKKSQGNQVLKNQCVLALGCMAFGTKKNDKDSFGAMQTAWDLGITHWDTALAYGSGYAEYMCSKFLKGKWNQVFIATKGTPGKKPESIIKSLHKSLKNLGTDTINLFYMHWPRSDVDMRPHFELLEKERELGTIGAIGVSNFSLKQLKLAREVANINAHQLCYNLYWRKAEMEMIPFCKRNDIAVISYSSIAQGILTGKFPYDPIFESSDSRSHTLFFQPDVWPYLFATTKQLKLIAATIDCPLHHLAIQWIIQKTGINSIIVGARNGSQVRDNVASLNRKVPDETINIITEISNEAIEYLPDEENIFRYYP